MAAGQAGTGGADIPPFGVVTDHQAELEKVRKTDPPYQYIDKFTSVGDALLPNNQ